MNDIIYQPRELPAMLKNMHEFITVNRERMIAAQAALRAMDKLGMTADARRTSLEIAQDAAETVLDAEVRVGEIFNQMPTQQGKRTDIEPTDSGVGKLDEKTKYELIEESGFSVKQAERFQQLANNPEYVAEAKREARENEELVTRAAVLKKIKDKPHVANNGGDNEWYTPKDYIDLARKVMGDIDLDPASNDIANKIVQAKTYYTAETNGLDKDWQGNVWMNPPYAAELISQFANKLIAELKNINNAIVLVNNATETEWFKTLIHEATAICFPYTRVKFYAPDGRIAQPLQGQALLYFGNDPKKFVDAFCEKGWCAYPA